MSNTPYERYKFLKSMLRQAPLPEDELNELRTLAEKFNPKMAKYITEMYEILT